MLKIAIDAGHSKNTAGKRCLKSIDPQQTREWVLNSRIAEKLEALLKDYDCEIFRVDDKSGTTDISLSKRVSRANEWKADIYLSIHHNAGINGGSGGGTEVYYYSTVSARKNQAAALYNAVVKETGLKGNRADKIKSYPYYVVKNTKMPAFLLENGFMDSKADTPIILTAAHAEKTAAGLLNFLITEFKLSKKQTAKPAESVSGWYRVQCGAFKQKTNAEILQKRLKAAGFEAVVVYGD